MDSDKAPHAGDVLPSGATVVFNIDKLDVRSNSKASLIEEIIKASQNGGSYVPAAAN